MAMIIGYWFVAALMVVGAAAMFIASLGLVRMPDLYMRMSGASKASTLGVASLALAAAIYFGELGVAARAGAVVAFVLLTTPIAAHMMSRAAYRARTPLWERTVVDELSGHMPPYSTESEETQ